jgi:DNA-binding SARP family transcriptional activator/tetratricopeptide (TPR) repeat protein
MEFRLLGPVEVVAGGRVLDAGPPRRRAVLAALLVDTGKVVRRETLIDRVWGEDPPPNARETLRTYLTRLRRTLEQAAEIEDTEAAEVVHSPGGYLLRADADRVDLHRFRRLVAGGGGSGDERVTRLREALALWRGEPLTGLTGEWAQRIREAWARERLDATAAWANAELRAGNAEAVIGPLSGLAAEHPLVESLTAALMRALHAAGRPTDALDRGARHRRELADTYGTDQSPDLRELYTAILRGEAEPAVTRTPVPAQLLADVPGFAGRKDHLARLDEHLGGRTAVVISGGAGVGKTALAVHWAHRVRDEFPDGQLYVNLRGFDPRGPVMDPADALRGFLDALDVAPQRIPVGVDAQAALYRSLLDGRRILVLLDNAHDAEQVRPLLPGSPGCLAVVTSRNQLTGMIATGSAQPVGLGLLSREEARELLAARLGPRRAAAEPGATDDIIDRCARLPLALTVVAARAATHPRFSLAALAAELGDGLDVLDGGDPASDVRTVFSWSLRQLTPAAARLFRLLGLHPGPDISAAMATSLAGQKARPMLAELARAHLLTEHVPGRYTFHDLLRSYAAELATGVEEPDAARQRLLDHALRSANAAAQRLNPHREPLDLAAARPGVVPETPADAIGWFTAEHAVLLGCLKLATDHGFDTHHWQLAWTLVSYLGRQGHRTDAVETLRGAVEAAARLGDRRVEAIIRRMLARSLRRLDRPDEAEEEIGHALTLFEALGDHHGSAHAYLGLSTLYERRGDYRRGLEAAKRAYDLFQLAGDRHGQAFALNGIGYELAHLGEYRSAVDACERALTVHRQIGDRSSEGITLDSLGCAYRGLGHYDRAIDCFRRAVEVMRETGDRFEEGEILVHLADTHLEAGDTARAAETWHRAVASLTEVGRLDDAEAARVRLAGLSPIEGKSAQPADTVRR